MFLHVNYFMHVYASNSCMLQKNVQQRPLGSHFSVGSRILCNTRLLSLLDRYLASRIDCSSLGPVNFAADFAMLNLETLKISKLNFLTLLIDLEFF